MAPTRRILKGIGTALICAGAARYYLGLAERVIDMYRHPAPTPLPTIVTPVVAPPASPPSLYYSTLPDLSCKTVHCLLEEARYEPR